MELSSFLKNKYNEKKEKNTHFSLRSFARCLGVSSGRLSEIMSGKSGITKLTALKIADKLHLENEEKEMFINLATETVAMRSKLVVEWHKKFILKSLDAADSNEIKENKFVTALFSVSESDIEFIKQEIELLINKVTEKNTANNVDNKKYSLNIALFELGEKK